MVALLVFQQIFRQFGYRGEGVRNRGHGLILEGKFLRAAGKLIMVNRRRFAQRVIVPGPVGDEQRPHLTQPGIVFRQNFQNRRVFKMILENPALLIENPVVLRQRRVIVGPQPA